MLVAFVALPAPPHVPTKSPYSCSLSRTKDTKLLREHESSGPSVHPGSGICAALTRARTKSVLLPFPVALALHAKRSRPMLARKGRISDVRHARSKLIESVGMLAFVELKSPRAVTMKAGSIEWVRHAQPKGVHVNTNLLDA